MLAYGVKNRNFEKSGFYTFHTKSVIKEVFDPKLVHIRRKKLILLVMTFSIYAMGPYYLRGNVFECVHNPKCLKYILFSFKFNNTSTNCLIFVILYI